ncbi:molybdopterin-dependent oxidoreductase [Albidovulum sp.]|uniref:molybdopterin-dependent oxidoreductase n=1 Tax=Albidovulum sp. TaxID=1872424 RepID=UPI002D072925|nr:molybdopterin-dependent oxidoreductase [Paracoccaceae bacterium]HPE26297.1 molybdopterin-dependent oxidoreductase [Albidovulum sp.]
MKQQKFWRLLATATLLAAAFPAGANSLPPLSPPKGEVLLTVCGKIKVRNQGDCAAFDLAEIRSVGPVTMETTTIWTDGIQKFEGVPLRALLERVGAEGQHVWAAAANDYGADIPLVETETEAPVIAYLLNGEVMSLRDKGPLWIVYPYDADIRYRSDVAYSRSVWQLVSLNVTE